MVMQLSIHTNTQYFECKSCVCWFCIISYKNENILKAFFVVHQPNACLLSVFKPIPSTPQLVPGGRTAQAVPRNATVFKNIPLAVTPKQGVVSVKLHTMALSVRKV